MEHQLTSIAFGAVVKDLGDCWQPRRPERLNQEGIGCGGETYVARDQRTRASAIRSQERRRLRSSASAVAAKRFAGIATRSENGADPLLLAASAPNSREAHSEQTRRPRDHPRPHPPRAPPNKPSVRRPCRRLGSRTRRTGGGRPHAHEGCITRPPIRYVKTCTRACAARRSECSFRPMLSAATCASRPETFPRATVPSPPRSELFFARETRPFMEAPSVRRPTGRSPDSGASGVAGLKSALDGKGMRTETLGAAGGPEPARTPLVA